MGSYVETKKNKVFHLSVLFEVPTGKILGVEYITCILLFFVRPAWVNSYEQRIFNQGYLKTVDLDIKC